MLIVRKRAFFAGVDYPVADFIFPNQPECVLHFVVRGSKEAYKS